MSSVNVQNRVSARLAALKAKGQMALIAYVTVGYPTPDATVDIVRALAKAGADAVELGIPFSDPLADGPTVQAASGAAIAAGTTVPSCLATAAAIRAALPDLPLLFMGYYNPMLQYGPERFAFDAVEAGVDGVIVPDLPLEEAEEFDAPCRAAGLGIVPLIAPVTPPERIAAIAGRGPIFLYVTSRMGVTGARGTLPTGLPELVQRARAATTAPLAVGFGISRAEHVATLRHLADAAVVGSALLEALGGSHDPAAAAACFLAPLAVAAHAAH
ncbi:MAG: tryptophan synthase subunit alpha [Anaerolineae bacterium]